jgi:quercetin dioxygenase-like cupin family protein
MKGLYIRTGSKKNIIVGKIIHREKKVWGEEHWIVNKEYCGKKLILKKDRRCSMHSHNKKDEVFYLQSGKVKMELKGTDHILNPGDIVHIPPQTPHRFTGLKDSEIFEFSTTHEEEDSYRTELSGHVEQERFDRQSALLKKFSKTSIIVIGDLMLDRYTYGSIDRISAEAPIPIVQTKGTKDLIGGAGNAAANICAIGARVRLIALCGKDLDGAIIKSLCKQKGIRTNLIFDPSRPTTLKHRITRNNNQQIVRIDTEETKQISAVQEQKILALLRTHAVSAHAILLSDYAKGVLTSKIFETAYALGKKHDIPVIVDPKPRGTSTLKHLQKAIAMKQ